MTRLWKTCWKTPEVNAESTRTSEVTARLHSTDKDFYIEVLDSGDAMPEFVATKLFKQILPSDSGYAIGLYQSAQLALRHGFKIELTNNQNGSVVFLISKS